MKLDSFEQQLSQIPLAKPETHFLLNDLALKMLKFEDRTEEEQILIDGIALELQDLDRDFVSYVDTYRQLGILSLDETSFVRSLFLVSMQTGPDLAGIRTLFVLKDVTPEEFENRTKNVSLPDQSRDLLNTIYRKTHQVAQTNVSA